MPPEPTGADPAAVVFTSGATGPAKGVRYRHAQLSAQRDALLAAYSITSDDRFVAAFAPFAILGPALGITSTIPDVDVTKPGTLTAGALAAACASVDATIVFAAPAALGNVVRTAAATDDRLGRIRLVLSAGAPVPIATLRAVSALCPHADLHTPYGMTECLPVADVSLVEIDACGTGAGVCVGSPVTGAEVIVAPLHFDAGVPVSPLASSVTGEVLVRAPWVSDGYDELWRTERDARPRDAEGVVWHRTGDVGHLDRDGRLWIEGRSVHVISTVSGPVTPVPIEVTVEAHGLVTRCAAVGVGPRGCQQVVVVVEDRSTADGLASDAVTSAVRAAVSIPLAAVLSLRALPVDIRHNAKIDRSAVSTWAAALLSGARTPRAPGARRR
jgi:acyl-CoA synthetase (AMP-forming)/AMP-acid ligase II